MSESRAADHAKGKVYVDKLFGTGMAAKAAVAKFGKDKVVDASMGAIADDEGKLICLPTVEKVWRSLPIQQMTNYSPVGGLPGFLEAAIGQVFGHSEPEGYIRAIASAGGAGAISNLLWNYTNPGDTVLTHDWFWTPYQTICGDTGRKLETFEFLDTDMAFNLPSLTAKVADLMARQNSLVLIINSPNHNPTGYCITDSEWDSIIELIRRAAKDPAKTISLLLDIAYIDFTKDPVKARTFFKKFASLPSNIIVSVAFSMSKSFTMYGQRVGALIGLSSSKDVIDEFEQVNLVTSRARWSNINRGGMQLLDSIYHDAALTKAVDGERAECNALIAKRANVFVGEATEIGLPILPYDSGFFITVPCGHSDEVSNLLIEEKVYVASLGKGVRVAACSVPAWQMAGLAKRIQNAITKANG